MSVGILIDADSLVADWYFKEHQSRPVAIEKAVGLVCENVLVGAIIFHYWNGSNIEVSYYGPGTMTVGIIRYISRVCLDEFDAARLTVVAKKKDKKWIRSLMKFGFRLEGAQRCYYGKKDCSRNTGIRLVMFSDQLEKLAGRSSTQAKAN